MTYSNVVLVVGQVPPPIHGSNVMTMNLLGVLDDFGFKYCMVEKIFFLRSRVNRFSFRKLLVIPNIFFDFFNKIFLHRPKSCIYFLSLGLMSFLFDATLLLLLRLFKIKYLLYIHGSGLKKIENHKFYC